MDFTPPVPDCFWNCYQTIDQAEAELFNRVETIRRAKRQISICIEYINCIMAYGLEDLEETKMRGDCPQLFSEIEYKGIIKNGHNAENLIRFYSTQYEFFEKQGLTFAEHEAELLSYERKDIVKCQMINAEMSRTQERQTIPMHQKLNA